MLDKVDPTGFFLALNGFACQMIPPPPPPRRSQFLNKGITPGVKASADPGLNESGSKHPGPSNDIRPDPRPVNAAPNPIEKKGPGLRRGIRRSFI